MNIEWKAIKDGRGSISFWYISEPIGTFIQVNPINRENGTMYRVEGPQLSRKGRPYNPEYTTLKRAMEVAEDLCIFSQKNPLRMEPIDLRDFPGSGVRIIDVDGNDIYNAEMVVGKEFEAPLE